MANPDAHLRPGHDAPEPDEGGTAAQAFHPPVRSAVLKVLYKDEVFRFRIKWPLEMEEVRASVLPALMARCPTPGATDAATASPSPVVLYRGAKGRLLELCDANVQDFLSRYSDPVQPIRLQAVSRVPPNCQPVAPSVVDCADNADLPDHSAVEAGATGDGKAEEASSAASAQAPTLRDAREEGTLDQPDEGDGEDFEVVHADAAHPTAGTLQPETQTVAPSASSSSQGVSQDVAPSAAASPSPLPSAAAAAAAASTTPIAAGDSSPPSQSSLGADFLSAPPGRSDAQSSTSVAQKNMSLPINARAAAYTAAYALGDAWDTARSTFSMGRAAILSPQSAEMQRALQASQDLHAAMEASAAQSRARLSKSLALYGVQLRPVKADGNCQFRALSVQLHGDEDHHVALRQRVVKQLQEKRERYEGYMPGTYEEYLERMAKDAEWGDNVTLQAASDLLKREIHVLTDRSELLEVQPEGGVGKDETDGVPQERPLCLAFLTEVHYDAVVIESA